MSHAAQIYREILGLQQDQPQNHYQLLGLDLFEPDLERIENASMNLLSKALRHEHGPQAAWARKILDELEQAKDCLTDPSRKATYDAHLRAGQASSANAAQDRPSADFDFDVNLSSPARMPVWPELQPAASDDAAPASSGLLTESPAALLDPGGSADTQLVEPPSPAPTKSSGPKTKAAAKPKPVPPRKPPGIPRKRLLPEMGEISIKTWAVPIGLIAVLLFVWVGVPVLRNMQWGADPRVALLEQLKSGDETSRLKALEGLKAFDASDETVAELIRLIRSDPSLPVKRQAASTLAMAGPAMAPVLDQLKSLAADEKDVHIRGNLEWMIAQVERAKSGG
jgi:hypothetical protein